MKLTKITAVVLAALTLTFLLASCGGAGSTGTATSAEISVNAKVTIIDAAGNKLCDSRAVTVTAVTPNVLGAIKNACAADDVTVVFDNDDDPTMVVSFNGVEGADGKFWSWTLNGKTISGRAGNQALSEGDIIVYQYADIVTD